MAKNLRWLFTKNVRLRCLLQEHGIQIPAAQSNAVIPVITNVLPSAHIPVLKILTRAMESRHQLGLDSYDRFFPNQDTMPNGGLSNLIALPLQKLGRESTSGADFSHRRRR